MIYTRSVNIVLNYAFFRSVPLNHTGHLISKYFEHAFIIGNYCISPYKAAVYNSYYDKTKNVKLDTSFD